MENKDGVAWKLYKSVKNIATITLCLYVMLRFGLLLLYNPDVRTPVWIALVSGVFIMFMHLCIVDDIIDEVSTTCVYEGKSVAIHICVSIGVDILIWIIFGFIYYTQETLKIAICSIALDYFFIGLSLNFISEITRKTALQYRKTREVSK